MREAIRWYSWKGYCVEKISSFAVKSPSSAQTLGPFVDENRKPVLWVNWGRRQDGIAIPPYFRHWPKGVVGRHWVPDYKAEITATTALKHESRVHLKAKAVCSQLLTKLIAEGKPLPWCFKDETSSDFPLSGNLLSNVIQVKEECPLKTPFDQQRYCFDIGLLGPKILEKPQLLGAIEFELTSRMGIWKTAVCKALGFPLMTVNLDGVNETQITEDWCYRILTETTTTSDDGQRRNYLFVHTMLYPVYLDLPEKFRPENRHRFIVFASDKELQKLRELLNRISEALELPKNAFLIQPHPNKNATTQKEMEHEGSMAGHDWKEYNDHFYLRISVNAPRPKNGPLYRLHLALAHLLNCQFDCLVGYKYQQTVSNNPDQQENPIWIHRDWRDCNNWTDLKVAPKHLSQPLRPLRKFLELLSSDQASPI